MSTHSTLPEVDLPDVKKVESGKARGRFDLGESFPLVAKSRENDDEACRLWTGSTL